MVDKTMMTNTAIKLWKEYKVVILVAAIIFFFESLPNAGPKGRHFSNIICVIKTGILRIIEFELLE